MRVSVIWNSALEVCFGSVRLRSGQVSCFAFWICRRTAVPVSSARALKRQHGKGMRAAGRRLKRATSDERRVTLHATHLRFYPSTLPRPGGFALCGRCAGGIMESACGNDDRLSVNVFKGIQYVAVGEGASRRSEAQQQRAGLSGEVPH